MMSSCFILKNIEQRRGRYRVSLWRSGKHIYGGTFGDLQQAIAARDKLAAKHPAQPPGMKGSGLTFNEYQRNRRARLRAAKLCIACQQPSETYECADCRQFIAAKRASKA